MSEKTVTEPVVGIEELQQWSYDKLRLEPKERQAKLVKEWRAKFTTKDICKALKISNSRLYNLSSSLGATNKPQSKRAGTTANNKPKQTAQVSPPVKTEAVLIERPRGLSVSYEGKFSAKDIMGKLDKLGLILDEESNQFEVKIVLKEIVK